MALDPIVRNLRDGQLVVNDAASHSVTLTLDMGDLEWTEPEETVQVMDRGVLAQARPGDEKPCDLTYSTQWVHLIGDSVTSSGDAVQFYELINERASDYVGYGQAGEKYMLRHTFTVTAPGAAANESEKILFAKVFKTSLKMGEGDNANRISFSGIDFETRPVVSRV